jgi:hypothetical protein
VKRLIFSGVLALGAGILFWTLQHEQPEAPRSAPDAGVFNSQTEPVSAEKPSQVGEPSPVRPEARIEEQLFNGPRLELQQGELEWEARVRRIRENSALNERAKVFELLKLLGGGLPEEALESVAEEAVRGLKNPDYQQVTGLLLDPQTHGRIQAVLFADLVERPDPVRLPWLLAVARVPGHPFGKVAAEDLELFLGVQHGGNWERWEESIRRSLAGRENQH